MLISQVDTLKKNAERVNIKLKSMASLQFGDKWNTSSQSPQKNTIITALLRTFWYRGESLDMTVADFNATLEEACMLVYECLEKHPNYQPDEQNILTRIIVQLTNNIADVKMAVVRQKGTYQNDIQKEAARSQLDDTITYIDDQLRQIREAVEKAGLKNKIDADYKARNHKTRNPIIISTLLDDSKLLVTQPNEHSKKEIIEYPDELSTKEESHDEFSKKEIESPIEPITKEVLSMPDVIPKKSTPYPQMNSDSENYLNDPDIF